MLSYIWCNDVNLESSFFFYDTESSVSPFLINMILPASKSLEIDLCCAGWLCMHTRRSAATLSILWYCEQGHYPDRQVWPA